MSERTKSPLERAEAQKWLELIQILQAEVAELKDEILLLREVIKNLGAGGAASEWPWKPSGVSPEK